MKCSLIAGLAGIALLAPLPAMAQDEGQSEVLLSASRQQQSGRMQTGGYIAEIPAIGFVRRADFAVRSVTIEGDTRDEELRTKEINGMVENTIRAAERYGLELSFGSQTIEELNLDNYADLGLFNGRRPDTSRISFLIKVPLSDASKLQDVEARMDDFMDAVKPVGRAQFMGKGAITLSLVKPDQYRSAIIDAISGDAAQVAGQIGPGYGVELKGLQRPTDWVRWGDLEVLLYIPYEMTVVPRG